MAPCSPTWPDKGDDLDAMLIAGGEPLQPPDGAAAGWRTA